jgi:putative heme-binding domain-containing protein
MNAMRQWLCAVACACVTSTSAAQPMPELAGASESDLAEGRRYFESQCAWCHGTDGGGGSGPSLQRARMRHAADDRGLVQIIRAGIPGTEMPPFALSLTDRAAWQTAAYVRSFASAKPVPLPGDPERGARVYETTGCAQCHVIAGKGGTLGPDLTGIGALRGPAHLRESLTKPEAAHPPAYLMVSAVTRSGVLTRGIRVGEDVFFVLLRDAQGALHSLEKKTLARLEREPNGTLMPSYAQLPAASLDDLVAYLASLRGGR